MSVSTPVYIKTKFVTPHEIAKVTEEVQLSESVVKPLAVIADKIAGIMLTLPGDRYRRAKIACFRCARMILPFRKVVWCLICYAMIKYLEKQGKKEK